MGFKCEKRIKKKNRKCGRQNIKRYVRKIGKKIHLKKNKKNIRNQILYNFIV